MSNYTITHLHTDMSSGTTNIDSVTKYTEYIDAAKDCGMTAIAFTEHGNVFSWLHKKEYCEKQGLKYIHGIEAYITESLKNKVRDNYHCVLLAKNYEGVKEINKLSSKSFNREDGHFYYMPRISFEELCNTSDNIIICTACLGSILNRGNDMLREKFISFLSENKHRCFLEIQHHNVEDQIEYNRYLYELSKTIGVSLITGTDTHALNERHLKGRSILQKAKDVHFAEEESWDLTFKTYDALVNVYKIQNSLPMDVVFDAINNTNKVADMVEEFEINRDYKYPHLWKDPMGLFKKKIQDGIKKRGVDKFDNYKEYLDRIDHEMEAYIHNGAIDFMLLMGDILTWCRANDIQVGYGRGSVNGSVIAWLLGITEMDSIKHGLNFDRFMNIERVSLSDIDTDFPPSRIEDVKNYIFHRHGLYCSDIITFNTIADKGAIRDVARALDIPLTEVSEICNSVDNQEMYAKTRDKYKELFEYVDIVKGTIVSIGSHPCGVIVSQEELDGDVGLCTTSTSNYPISQLNMKEIDSLNYVKLDILKLDTIELINETCKLAGIERLTPDNVDINDKNVWDSIRDDTTQIFQWEGSTGDNYIKKLLSDENIEKFKSVNEDIDRMTLLSIGNSAIRPAGASYRDDLANGVVRKTGSKPIDDFLSNTFGYLVFQCQIIDFLHEYCGFTMGEADLVRRGFAKKTGTDKYIPIIKNGGYMSENGKHYIDGFIKTMKNKYGIDEKKSEEDIIAFIQVIEDASSYLFSLNHSAPYSYEGYVSGWLRTYYPLEFLTVALNINADNQTKTAALTKFAKKLNIDLKTSKFRFSRAKYFCDKKTNSIYKGIGSIKNLNEKVAEEMYALRNNKYNSFVDLLFDLNDKTSLNTRQRDILIKIDFFSEFGDINKMLDLCRVFDEIHKTKSTSQSKAEELGLEMSFMQAGATFKPRRVDDIDFEKYARDYDISDLTPYEKRKRRDGSFNGYSLKKFLKDYKLSEKELFEYSTKIIDGKYSDYNLQGVLNAYYLTSEIPPCTLAEKMKYQLEFLGYIDYKNEDLDPRYVVVTELDTKYSPKFKAYCMKTGETCEMKVKNKLIKKDPAIKSCFEKNPFENGDILYMTRCRKENKRMKVNGDWIKSPDQFCWWIIEYSRCLNV